MKKPARNTTPRPRRTLRLSPQIRPEQIELHFDLDPRRKSFRGEACYSLQLAKATRQIELHSAELRVSAVRASLDGESFDGHVEAHPECETILLRFDRALRAGDIRLTLEFRGAVRHDLRGLYRSTDRQEPWLASQLCPTDARRFFPCFDEPGIKACYSICVTAPNDQVVLSNSPVAHATPVGSNRKRVCFESTPPLSAYLIAVAVGPFVSSPVVRVGATEIRVYTLPGKQRLARFAREAAVESLARLERWFDMDHPYSKLDLLALPDFAFGAMENAGAVFFRDSVLLLDEKEASAEDRMRAAETIAHEISHMWFGNLVTMAWWNDLWLNESFATWMAYEIVESWKPEWQLWLEFIQRRESALTADALTSSHPIAPPIRTAQEAHENFDAITYTKGASVLRMLERFLGARVFRDGVRRYVRQHREGSATASHLWAALSEACGREVEPIVAPWTLETGFPLIGVRRESKATGGADGLLSLRQERFLTLTSSTPARSGNSRKSARSADTPRWSVPWVGRVGRGAKSREIRHLLDRAHDATPIPGARPSWIYGNSAESGFFRIEHGKEGFDDLITACPHLSDLERLGLLGNQWALVLAGRAGAATILDLIAALGSEQNPSVLFAIEEILSNLLRRVLPDAGIDAEHRMQAWIERQFRGQVEELDLEGRGLDGRSKDSLSLRRRRAKLLAIVGGLAASPKLAERCLVRARSHFASRRRLPIGAADETMRIAASVGDRDLQRSMLGEIKTAETPQIRRRHLFALAGFDRPSQLRVTLRATLDPRLAPSVDRAGLLMHLLASPRTAHATWLHLQDAWPRLEKEMPPILLARVVAQTSAALSPTEAPAIRRFFAAHPLAAGDRVIRQVSEEMAIGKRLRNETAPDLVRALEADVGR